MGLCFATQGHCGKHMTNLYRHPKPREIQCSFRGLSKACVHVSQTEICAYIYTMQTHTMPQFGTNRMETGHRLFVLPLQVLFLTVKEKAEPKNKAYTPENSDRIAKFVSIVICHLLSASVL